MKPSISLVICCYNMARELPRTIRSLSPAMQNGVLPSDYELIVVDNGSTIPFEEAACRNWGAELRVLRFDGSSPSPARAINAGIDAARGSLIGVMIDGARLASPGLIAMATMADKMAERAVILTLGFHLGTEVQVKSILRGYDQDEEDRLLASSGWTEDGYRLFDISVPAASASLGWFAPMNESNAIFMRRSLWKELGGLECQFESPGGGLVNLDLLSRACQLPDVTIVTLLGEGTFHQIHGGVATNAKESPREVFRAEYAKIRGRRYQKPAYRSLYFGSVSGNVLASIADSAKTENTKAGRARTGDGSPRLSQTAPDFSTAVPAEVLATIQQGVIRTRYRGVPFLKSPFDIALYMQLIERLHPATVIEIGTKAGGSALWFADMMAAHGLSPRVMSVDIDADPEFKDERICFLRGDANDLGKALGKETLGRLPHPWLVVEDSAHLYEPCLAVLRFFHAWLQPGDYIVIEDGVVAHLPGQPYGHYQNGPNRAVAAFLETHGSAYSVDAELCDFFGKNVTYNPRGWLVRR
jgi:cephalosporin hydroxylase/glycosyltransferase involved in cell wall biosynthesis